MTKIREAYFWTKVSSGLDASECWEWKGFRSPKGYGKYGRILAHRLAYELSTGQQIGDLCVCHKCDNPPCCNPKHLFLGTRADNTADMIAKGRRVVGPTRRGEASNKAKLTGPQALEIFRSNSSNTELADKYGITRTAVYYIKTGKNWRHLTGASHAQAE